MIETALDEASLDLPHADLQAAGPWLDAIKAHDRAFSKYHESADRIDALYADLERAARTGGEREFQIFWANLEVLKPSIYARPPVPVVANRFKDRRPVHSHASEVLERALSSSFDREDIDATMRLVRDDLTTNARGVVWLRYVDGERIDYGHVDRKDFAHEVARKWKEVGWVARRSWLTREQGQERFGDAWREAVLTNRRDGDADDAPMAVSKAPVWEIWSKTHNVVVWVSPGMDRVLDIQPPFLSLEGFFPCPRPAYGTLERGTLRPVPDFVYYKDQVEEINELTARISALAEALRMKGFYSAGVEALSDAIEAALRKTDNNAVLIPVPNTAALGGTALKEAIVWLPVSEVAAVISQLIALRRQLMDDVYQITGLSDIMRGATNPNETLGAQQLKSQFGSVRVRDRQFELVRMARDIARMAGEIIAENFSAQSIKAMAQYDVLPSEQLIAQRIAEIEDRLQAATQDPDLVAQVQTDPELREQARQLIQRAEQELAGLAQTITWEQVLQLLSDERMRPFVLEIETDSTVQPDEFAAKAAVSEFLGALSQALAQLGPMVSGRPETAPFAAEILKMAVSPFRVGRKLDAAIDEFAEQLKAQAAKPIAPAADPRQEKIRADIQKTLAQIEKIKAEIAKINRTTASMEGAG